MKMTTTHAWKEIYHKKKEKWYYANADTKKTTWKQPDELRISKEEEDDWQETVDDQSGRTFYYNEKLGLSRWTKPLIKGRKPPKTPTGISRMDSTSSILSKVSNISQDSHEQKQPDVSETNGNISTPKKKKNKGKKSSTPKRDSGDLSSDDENETRNRRSTSSKKLKITSENEKQMKVRNLTIKEVQTTEHTYVSQLKTLLNVYLKPLCETSWAKGNKLFLQMYKHVGQIYPLNVKFLEGINERLETWSDFSSIGDLFSDFAPFMKMYLDYVKHHEPMTKLVIELRGKEKFVEYLSELARDPRAKGMTLGGFLILPVQRIPRYKLFLETILKYTPESHNDYVLCQKALDDVKESATLINTTLNRLENAKKISQIQKLFVSRDGKLPSWVAPHRKLMKQGVLMRKCRSSDKPFTFFLFNDLLVFATKRAGGKYRVNKELPIDSSFVLIPSLHNCKNEHAWQINSPVKSFVCYAQSKTDKSGWIEEIKKSIIATSETIQESAEGKKAQPRWVSDKESKTCGRCSKKFTVIRRRHHCRNCGKLVCGNCSKHKMHVKGHRGLSRACDVCFLNSQNKIDKVAKRSRTIKSRGFSVVDAKREATLKKGDIADYLKTNNLGLGEGRKNNGFGTLSSPGSRRGTAEYSDDDSSGNETSFDYGDEEALIEEFEKQKKTIKLQRQKIQELEHIIEQLQSQIKA